MQWMRISKPILGSVMATETCLWNGYVKLGKTAELANGTRLRLWFSQVQQVEFICTQDIMYRSIWFENIPGIEKTNKTC